MFIINSPSIRRICSYDAIDPFIERGNRGEAIGVAFLASGGRPERGQSHLLAFRVEEGTAGVAAAGAVGAGRVDADFGREVDVGAVGDLGDVVAQDWDEGLLEGVGDAVIKVVPLAPAGDLAERVHLGVGFGLGAFNSLDDART